jgi:maltose alpha-D-glucosyltransferase/alpha-amylase
VEEPLVTFALADLQQLLGDNDLMQTLKQDILPGYLGRRRWFGSKGQDFGTMTVVADIEFPLTDIKIAQLKIKQGARIDTYFLPLALVWEDVGTDHLSQVLALARVQLGGRYGLLTDGFSRSEFAIAAVRCLGDKPATTRVGDLEFVTTGEVGLLANDMNFPIRWLSAEQSNSSLIIGEGLMVKLIRHVFPGVHPEVEMTRHLTLSGYKNTATLVGEVAVIAPDGARSTFLLVQEAVANQGDAWTWMLSHLRAVTGDAVTTDLDSEQAGERLTPLVHLCGKIGQRLAELHLVLAKETDDEAFRPVIVLPDDAASIGQDVRQQIDRAFSILQDRLASFSDQVQHQVKHLLQQRKRIMAGVDRLARGTAGSLMTRTHGDFHLGQVLVSGDDAFIIDFEGEPARDLDQRRTKVHPLRDVAGLLRSIDYLTASIDNEEPESGQADTADSTAREKFVNAAKKAFIGAYFTASASVRARRTPVDCRDDTIELFLLEKAAYEIEYEARNRPSWLPIAIEGFITIASQLD